MESGCSAKYGRLFWNAKTADKKGWVHWVNVNEKKKTERKKQSDMKPNIGAKNFKILWKKVFCAQYSVHNADNNVNFVLFHMKKLSCSYW